MKITINTDVLKKYNLSLGQYLVLLSSYHNLDCQKIQNELVDIGLAERDLFKEFPPVLSDNTKNLIAKIMVESDDRAVQSGIDFDELAKHLQGFYPDGVKPGKTYPWRGDTEEIAQKLRTLVVKYNFPFTAEEAIRAVEEYVAGFKAPYTYMHTLKNFILYTKKENGKYEMESLFMTIIENNRENENSN